LKAPKYDSKRKIKFGNTLYRALKTAKQKQKENELLYGEYYTVYQLIDFIDEKGNPRQYLKKMSKNENVCLMGDSAGGGFVLSFCQYLKTIDLPQPDEIIVFSPWVDIGMSNPPYDNESDPILGEVGLREMGKSWAGDWSLDDYRVSPTFGDNKDLPKMIIFAGDNEIFHKDIVSYVEKLEEDGVDVKFVVAEGMFHIYPLYAKYIPESADSHKRIMRFVSKHLKE
jgi:acetyl esterase/lipase